ncbi:YidB family protein [Anaeromyxobacter sp. PSR-1]|uniref:YidB family protein n=2 Tax=unclassified Anaeromyxobacter TaxID=2620896 RepID=UPI0005E91443|nr:YidB family protein [Anaeromyxobacter sp. PSR-1]GAO04063.1 putative protein [Anaeromyxobacter sp. PSR-1]
MGILDELTKGLGAGAPGAAPAAGGQGSLIQAVMGLLSGGGLQQLVASFQQKGLGDVIGSWVSTGPNQPISPGQLGEALGADRLRGLAQQTGLDAGALTSQLSSLLPGLVDRLTPDGKLPDAGSLQEKLGSALKGLF